jgi:hypothetical protein
MPWLIQILSFFEQSGWNESLASKATNHEPTLLLLTENIPFVTVFGLSPRPRVTYSLCGICNSSHLPNRASKAHKQTERVNHPI